jgi:hypothetical protein
MTQPKHCCAGSTRIATAAAPGTPSPNIGGSYMRPLTRALAHAIPTATMREIDGTAHAVAFDAPGNFVQVIAEAIRSSELRSGTWGSHQVSWGWRQRHSRAGGYERP